MTRAPSVASHKLKTLHEMPSTSSDWTARQPHAHWVARNDEAARTDQYVQERLPRRLVLNGDGTMTQRQRYRTDSGEVLTKDELRQRLTAELEAMDPQTRAANCDGTIDDLITDSMLVGIYKREDAE